MEDDDRSFPQRGEGTSSVPNPTTEATQRAAGPNFFRDGENVQFMRAESLLDHSFNDNVMKLVVKTSQQSNRTAQTHDSVMHQFINVPDSPGEMHFHISFATEEIFRVKFSGTVTTLQEIDDDPKFPPPEARMLAGIPRNITVNFEANVENEIVLKSSAVEIRVSKTPFRLRAYTLGTNAPFWQQRMRDLFTSDIVPTSIATLKGRYATFEAFTLDPTERLFGLGERFDGVERRGRPVDFVNHDAIGTSNTRSYINVPFFWSTKGYGCFVNSVARTEWDMGLSEAGTVGFCTEEKFMDYFVIHGPDPKTILKHYTNDLTGVSPLPPIWAFGLWLSRNSYLNWNVVDEVLSKAEEHHLPLDVVHLDTAWFEKDWDMDLEFGSRFPEPEKKMAALAENGVHVTLWQYNFIPPIAVNPLYNEAKNSGYLAHETLLDGNPGPNLFSYPPDSKGWRLDDCVIDFSNPAAAHWHQSKISHLIVQGASGIKTDFGDCIPPDASYQNIQGKRFQNLYSLVYNASVRKAVLSIRADTAQWARSGTAGSQRYPVHWGGDSQCSFSALQGSLRANLSIGLSGFAYFSHDIGGFIGKPSPELYIRWAQLAMWSSHTRCHGAGDENGREPWFFGDDAVTIFTKFTQMRYRLLPYIIEECRSGATVGLPLVRALILEYPLDRNVWQIETQFMFGSHILVAPVLQPREDADNQSVYLPAGTWYDFWDKTKIVSRGEWIERDVTPLDKIPIWVKEGAVICWTDLRMRTWNKVGEVSNVEVYLGGDGVYKCGDGQGGMIHVKRGHEEGQQQIWKVEGRDNVSVGIFS